MKELTFPGSFDILSFLCFGSVVQNVFCNNIQVLTQVKNNFMYIGCFNVWEEQLTKLNWEGVFTPLNQSYGVHSCTAKCANENTEAQLVFIRMSECHCVPTPNDHRVSARRIHDDLCYLECPEEVGAENYGLTSYYSCGSNIGYSVYCTPTSSSACTLIASQINQKYPMASLSGQALSKQNFIGNPIRDIPCGVCDGNLCRPSYLSPAFDYFPFNCAKECAAFCSSDISYAEVNESGATIRKFRNSTSHAGLLWQVVNGSDFKLPICLCGNEEIKKSIQESPGRCDATCPGNPGDLCGESSYSHEILISVYCIERGNGRCVGGSSTSTTTKTSTTSHSSTTSTTTSVQTTKPPSTSQKPSVTTDSQTTSMFPGSVKTTTKSTTFIDTSTTTPIPFSTDTRYSPKSTFIYSTESSEPTTSTQSSEPITSTQSSAPRTCLECIVCCSKKDRHHHEWTACANQTRRVRCSELIRASTGEAFWKCNENGNFVTPQPNVSQCKSKWVQNRMDELSYVNNTREAIGLTNNLSEICNKPQDDEYKYFGSEIASLITLMNENVWKVRQLIEPLEKFQELVNETVKLHACLFSYPDPWNDLPLPSKSDLSTRLMLATESVLFRLTEYVKINERYSAVFTPMQQFTAAAETFDRSRNESVRDQAYVFPPYGDPNRESCIKLPEKWTRLLANDKVEVAIITIATESVAQVTTGSRIYEVNGLKNKIINGRIISLSVTSSNQGTNYKSQDHIIKSRSLKFEDKGVEIAFHHNFDVDSHGDRAYVIRRKLHEGELPRAILKSAECVFWDVNENMWSSRGCKLVKVSQVETVCECNHLTSFAVLMDIHSYIGKQLGLTILTLILCPLSEIALFFTIIILFVLGNRVHKARTTISKHLSFCLFLGNGMVLLVLDRNYFHMSDAVCKAAAITTHYIFLCAFMWMLFEGVQLYRMVVNVFESGKSYMAHFGTIAYGAPLIIIALTAGLGDQPYGGNAYCWLLGNYIWAFMAPVAVVITINLIILFIALKTTYQLQHQGLCQKNLFPILVFQKIRSFRMYFRGCFSLTVILGITWVVGFFTLMDGSTKLIAAYLFTILNASQGFFIFLFTCRTYKVVLFTRRKFSSYFPSALYSTSNHSSMGIKKLSK